MERQIETTFWESDLSSEGSYSYASTPDTDTAIRTGADIGNHSINEHCDQEHLPSEFNVRHGPDGDGTSAVLLRPVYGPIQQLPSDSSTLECGLHQREQRLGCDDLRSSQCDVGYRYEPLRDDLRDNVFSDPRATGCEDEDAPLTRSGRWACEDIWQYLHSKGIRRQPETIPGRLIVPLNRRD